MDKGVDPDGAGWDATRAWVEKELPEGEHVENAVRLRGGWTSQMRRLDLRGPGGRRSLVLRSFVKPFFVRHAEGLLTREAAVLRLLGDTDVPAATLVALDATAQQCAHPSLLMSLLPGTVRLGDQHADDRAELLARQLVRIHRLPLGARQRPRTYQAWTSPERVTPPADTERPELWRRAVDVIRRKPPACQGCFLHRDFHPGNVLFTGGGTGGGLRISGVVGRTSVHRRGVRRRRRAPRLAPAAPGLGPGRPGHDDGRHSPPPGRDGRRHSQSQPQPPTVFPRLPGPNTLVSRCS
ncbi:phosphotransferase family protein [Streptomyces nanshensis]|uniref:phosphotransferase family protein n=1 Tax=Streptomyces nanshensis TaxID=518642 RepID=UPI0009A07543|nr:phosphotransferase [Streptomyces nanshensis]